MTLIYANGVTPIKGSGFPLILLGRAQKRALWGIRFNP